MTPTDMRSALQQMRQTQYAADENAELAAELIVGRLRRLRGSTLRKLKQELRDFNMHTERWKDLGNG